ncbi:hypothetical protein Ciccas_000420 [Cichlidogyrus casuarinus]|uniref:Uncharacterized protein n=1 Tax=Cichlidogyrus casuarinus TaxID=1844966 RepID=A0ABD2QMY2_9PLAT
MILLQTTGFHETGSLSADCHQLISAGAGDNRVYLVDINRAASSTTGSSGQHVVRSMSGHKGPVYSLTVWAPGSFFISGSADGSARLWDTRVPAPVLIIPSYSGYQGNSDIYRVEPLTN